MKFSIKDFFSKYDQIHSKLPIWSHLLTESLMENFTLGAEMAKRNVKFLRCEQSMFGIIHEKVNSFRTNSPLYLRF